MQNSGEVERLKRRLGDDFTYTNDQLNKNERAALNGQGAAFKRATIRYRNARNGLRRNGRLLADIGSAAAGGYLHNSMR